MSISIALQDQSGDIFVIIKQSKFTLIANTVATLKTLIKSFKNVELEYFNGGSSRLVLEQQLLDSKLRSFS